MSESRPPVAPRATDDFPDALPRASRPKPIQFSMRTLLIAMTAVAVIAAILPADAVVGMALYVLFYFAPLICLVTAAVYARGTWQTFFIGAACAALIGRSPSLVYSSSLRADQMAISIVWTCILYPVGGGLAILARRFIERRGWHLPPKADENNPSK